MRQASKIGQIIKQRRKTVGISLRELKMRCGISIGLISNIENGIVKDPRFSTVVRLSRALYLDLDHLIDTVRD